MVTFEQLLGRVIADRRRDRGLSQEALADRCDLHATYISQLERGLKSPTVRVLRSVGTALDTSAWKLLQKAEALATKA